MAGLTTMPKPTAGDLVAGISVALVALPQSLAYAEIAGMPPQYGLFASALPAILAAFFVSSRYLQTGPVALTALLTFGALEPLAADGSRFGRACVWRNVETGDPLIVEELFHSTLACE